MKINLRKASALQALIRTAISEQNALITGQFEVPVWKVNDEHLAVERGKQMLAIDVAERLEKILVSIRDQVGKTNVKSRISSLLSEQIQVSSQITRYTKLLRCKVMPSSADLEHQSKMIIDSNEKSSYHKENSFTVGVFAENDFVRFKNMIIKLKRRQVEINDELISQNIANEIAILDNDWTWLEEQGIV